jgi:tyrosine-protein kinase Etk/Wzc
MKTKRLLLDLLNRWYWILLCVLIGLGGAAYYLSKAPKKYSSNSTLLIKQRTSSVMGKDQVEEVDMGSSEGLNTVAERIRRLDLLERVASRADVRALPGLIPPAVDWTPALFSQWYGRLTGKGGASPATAEPPPPASVPTAPVLGGMLSSWMRVSIRRGTRLMDITFTHEVPEVAKELANAVAREYLAEIANTVAESRSFRTETLVKQSEDARTQLQVANTAMATYTRALELHKALESAETVGEQMRERYLPKHPKMISAASQIESLRKRFMDEFELASSAAADEGYWKKSGAEIEASKADPEAHLKVARKLLLARTNVLRGEIESQAAVYNAMLTRLEVSNVNSEGEESGADVDSFARVPGWPTQPNPKKIYTNGGAGGALVGLLLAFLLVKIDNKYHSVAQVEAEAGLPVLAAISVIDQKVLDRAIRIRARKLGPEPEFEGQDGWDPLLLFHPGTQSTTFAEMFRVLRASITLLGDESKRKVALFSSALPGEGKSLVSSNFALAAAGQGRRTLLIDLDLRKPSLHRVFGFSRAAQGPGITEWLAGQASLEDVVLTNVGCDNLHLALSGKRAPSPGELLNVARLKDLFAEAAEKYDLVVVDSAPLLAVPDTRVIAPLVDNFCLVVRADYVPKGAVMRALELLASADSLPAGLVFNSFKESRRMIGQNYSYGAYRPSKYGNASRYGYGSYGSYGTYGADDAEEELELAARKKKRRKQSD